MEAAREAAARVVAEEVEAVMEKADTVGSPLFSC